MAKILPRQNASKDPMPQKWMHLSQSLGNVEGCRARGNSPPRQCMAGIRRNGFQRKWMREGHPSGAFEIVVGALVGVDHDEDVWRCLGVLLTILGLGSRRQSLRLRSSAIGNFGFTQVNVVRA